MDRPTAFRFRLATRADLPVCCQLLSDVFRPGTDLEKIVAFWGTLIDQPSPLFTVIEDMTRPHPSSVEAFGVSAFVSEELFERLTADPKPNLAARVYDHALANDGTVLNVRDVAKANAPAAGLSVVVLHFGLRNPDMTDARTQQAVQIGSAAFYFTHSGYQLKALLNEVYGDQHKRFMEAGGFRLCRDFRADSPEDFSDVSPARYPYLFELRKEWVESGAVNHLAQLFNTPPPIIHFSRGEQRLLVRSLLNESDSAIAGALGISTDAVKKAWHSIYDRVDRRADFLLKPGSMSADGRRSQEKRRHLLEYLRTHPEELRPCEKPR